MCGRFRLVPWRYRAAFLIAAQFQLSTRSWFLRRVVVRLRLLCIFVRESIAGSKIFSGCALRQKYQCIFYHPFPPRARFFAFCASITCPFVSANEHHPADNDLVTSVGVVGPRTDVRKHDGVWLCGVSPRPKMVEGPARANKRRILLRHFFTRPCVRVQPAPSDHGLARCVPAKISFLR